MSQRKRQLTEWKKQKENNNNRHDFGDAVCAKIFMYFHGDRCHPLPMMNSQRRMHEMRRKRRSRRRKKKRRKSNQAVATYKSLCLVMLASQSFTHCVVGVRVACIFRLRPSACCICRANVVIINRYQLWRDDNKYAADAFSNIFSVVSSSLLLSAHSAKWMAPRKSEE